MQSIITKEDEMDNFFTDYFRANSQSLFKGDQKASRKNLFQNLASAAKEQNIDDQVQGKQRLRQQQSFEVVKHKLVDAQNHFPQIQDFEDEEEDVIQMFGLQAKFGHGYDSKSKDDDIPETLSDMEIDPLFPDYSGTGGVANYFKKKKAVEYQYNNDSSSQSQNSVNNEQQQQCDKVKKNWIKPSVIQPKFDILKIKGYDDNELRKRSNNAFDMDGENDQVRTKFQKKGSLQQLKKLKNTTIQQEKQIPRLNFNQENKQNQSEQYDRNNIYWNSNYSKVKAQQSKKKQSAVVALKQKEMNKTPKIFPSVVEQSTEGLQSQRGGSSCSRKIGLEYSLKIKRKNKEILSKKKKAKVKSNDPVSRFAEHKDAWSKNVFLKSNKSSIKEGRKLDIVKSLQQNKSQKVYKKNFDMEIQQQQLLKYSKGNGKKMEVEDQKAVGDEENRFDFYEVNKSEEKYGKTPYLQNFGGVVLEDQHQYDQDSQQDIIIQKEGVDINQQDEIE